MTVTRNRADVNGDGAVRSASVRETGKGFPISARTPAHRHTDDDIAMARQ